MSAPERVAPWLLLLTACSFNEGGVAGDHDAAQIDAASADGAVADATVDAPPGTPDAMADATPEFDAPCVGDPLGFQPSNFTRCDLGASNPPVTYTVGTWTLDGDTGVLTSPAAATTNLVFVAIDQPSTGPLLSVFTFDDIDIPTTTVINVTGTHPVALVSLADIVVDGTLSVGANANASGPGGDLDALCGTGMGRGTLGVAADCGIDSNAVVLAGQGGGGGGFGTAGGNGGPVIDAGVAPAGGPLGGNTSLIPLRGGCAGGAGGNTGGGAGGGAGGGLQLVSATSISVSGTGRVTARGGNGIGSGGAGSAGGGGGSGGG
ncbi:MAG TPA: hypothetical protein VL172_18205, partial [Kofleriaceae bacterium]|nr:hypothetical protein [Kofleriaceae bacterium]